MSKWNAVFLGHPDPVYSRPDLRIRKNWDRIRNTAQGSVPQIYKASIMIFALGGDNHKDILPLCTGGRSTEFIIISPRILTTDLASIIYIAFRLYVTPVFRAQLQYILHNICVVQTFSVPGNICIYPIVQ